jgi:hypothetical protein
VTGVEQAGDFIFMQTGDDGRVRFGFDHWGGGGAHGDWLPADPASLHTVEISLGSLFPLPGHVLLSRYPADEVTRLKRQVLVLFDGAVALESDAPAYAASPYDVYVGQNPIGGSSCGYAFSGRIVSVERFWPAIAPDNGRQK